MSTLLNNASFLAKCGVKPMYTREAITEKYTEEWFDIEAKILVKENEALMIFKEFSRAIPDFKDLIEHAVAEHKASRKRQKIDFIENIAEKRKTPPRYIDLESDTFEFEELEDKIKSLEETIVQKDNALNAANDSVKRLTDQLKQKDEIIQQLEFEIDKLEKENQALHTSLASLNGQDWKEKYLRLEQAHIKLRQHIETFIHPFNKIA